jgi:hypothetical protein
MWQDTGLNGDAQRIEQLGWMLFLKIFSDKDKELELLLLTIKNGLFRGEYVETVYNLTLKLQKQLVDLKYKNSKL